MIIPLWCLILSFFSFVLGSSHLHGSAIDLETLPYLRTCQYTHHPFDRIIVFSAPRTGSSLVYNVCRFLFEKEENLQQHHDIFELGRSVLKTHRRDHLDLIPSGNTVYLLTMRDPIEASISNCRICTRKITDYRDFARQLIERHLSALLFSEQLERTNHRVVRLPFELFSEDIDWLFLQLESTFRIHISDEDKALLSKALSKENISRNIESFSSFSEFLPSSGFHGKHLQSEEYKVPPTFIKWLKIYFEESKKSFEKYGYGK